MWVSIHTFQFVGWPSSTSVQPFGPHFTAMPPRIKAKASRATLIVGLACQVRKRNRVHHAAAARPSSAVTCFIALGCSCTAFANAYTLNEDFNCV